MALPTLQRKLFENDGYGPKIKDERLSTDITVKDWDSSHDYPVSVLAKAGGAIYRSVAASGPATAAGAKDPTADDGTYWIKMSSMADIAALNYATEAWVNNRGYALDSNVVHKTGTETITGFKYFYQNLFVVGYDNPSILSAYYIRSPANYNTARPDTQNYGLTVQNSDGSDFLSRLLFFRAPNNEGVGWNIDLKAVSGGTVTCGVEFGAANDETHRYFVFSEYLKTVRPDKDKAIKLGTGTFRWSQLYAGTSTIATSDEREKSSISSVPDDVLDAWGAVDFVQYQFNDSIAEKGAGARFHSGLIAQRVDAAFKAAGLDASRYGLFCHDAWEAQPEKRDESGAIQHEAVAAGDRYSIRYEEALCMEAACQRRRAERAEARIASLEARLAALEAKLNG